MSNCTKSSREQVLAHDKRSGVDERHHVRQLIAKTESASRRVGGVAALIVESLLGIELQVDKLRFAPCLPADWKGFKLHYRYRETLYHITVRQIPSGEKAMRVSVDGIAHHDQCISLVDDRKEHWVEVRIPGTKR